MGNTAEEKAAMKQGFVSQVPLGRMATTEEVSRWIVVLTDPSVTWITGQIFGVDGGMGLT